MKIKGENKVPIIIAIGVIIVVVLVVKDFKDRNKSTNYSNLTSEEITAPTSWFLVLLALFSSLT